MHELSIALSIIDGVMEESESACWNAGQITAVHLRVGRLSGVDKDALQFSYRVSCEGTPLVRSQLVIQDVDVVIQCPQCRAERSARALPLLCCAECGALAERVIRGEELEISGLEMAA